MNEKVEELLVFYALGAVTDDERAQVEAYIATDPEAKLRLEEMMQTAAKLPFDAAPVRPSEDVKRKLMDRVNADARTRFAPPPQTPASSWSRFLDLFRPGAGNWAPQAIAVLSLIIAIGTGAWALSLRNQYVGLQNQNSSLQAEMASLRNQSASVQTEVDSLTQELAVQREELALQREVIAEVASLREELALQREAIAEVASLRQELALQREVIARVTSPDSQTFAISGTEHQPEAHGQLIAGTKTGSAVLLVSDLQQLEAGRIYEFWLIKDNAPVAAGLFKVDDEGDAVLQVSQIIAPGSYDAIAVSIEPEAGSVQPTGDIVMLGGLD